MTARIRRLPPEVVDRIAAGEVVERPASVVKELVENALDAGATRIEVDVEGGGRDALVVRDDGVGMGADDLALAFVSHATSKLADVSDLDHIASFGFRGEALASISAVADVRIVTRERGAAHGHEAASRGGDLSPVTVAASPEGTRVEVRHLFRYVPARRKFLRAAGTEMAHVTATLHRIAIANPGVAFALTRSGTTVFRVAADEDRAARIARFFGRRLYESLIPVDAAHGDVRVSGHVATPDAARPTATWLQLYVNGRPVRDRALTHAVRHGYEGLLTRGQNPVAFLFVELPPERVDVNVHPAKTEVRFQDGEAVHRVVRHAVRAALLSRDLAPSIVPDAVREVPADAQRAAYLEVVGGALADFLARPHPAPAHEHGRAPAAQPRSAASPAPHALPAPPPRAARRYLQVRDTFLVFEVDDGIAIVDQHALHERILLEEIEARVRDGSLEVQPLLVPELVELPGADVEALVAESDELARLGVRISRFGETTLAVHALPALLGRRAPARVIEGLAERLRAGRGTGSRASLLDSLMHSMACRGAVMAGDPLDERQAGELLRRADLIDNPHGCAHGRPTSLRVRFGELERHFRRS